MEAVAGLSDIKAEAKDYVVKRVCVAHLRRFELRLGSGSSAGARMSQTGGVTVAYMEHDGVVEVAIARCSTKDVYNRKLGRKIAVGRFLTGKTVDVTQGPTQCAYGAIFDYVSKKKQLRKNVHMYVAR